MLHELEPWKRVAEKLYEERARILTRMESGNYETFQDYKQDAGKLQGLKFALETAENIDRKPDLKLVNEEDTFPI